MGKLLTSELNILRQEVESANAFITVDKDSFARKIKGGMGEYMREYIKNPPKPSKKLKIKLKWLRFKKEMSEGFHALLMG